MKPYIRPRLAAVCVALLLCPLLVNGGAPSAAQSAGNANPSGEQFSVEATSVVVDVIVTDKHGRPVSNLTANDFRVYEEGKEQKVTTFAPPNPAAYTEPAAAAPKTATSTPGAPTALPATEKRPEQFLTVVLDLTDNRMSSIQQACETVIKYLKKNKTTDTAVAIYYLSHGLRLALPFTDDMQKAEATLQALAHHAPAGAGGDHASIQQDVNELYVKAHPESQLGASGADTMADPSLQAAPMDPFAAMYQREYDTLRTYMALQNSYHARDIFVALRALALSYRDIPGRKNVVLFSEGFSFDNDSRPEMESVVHIANQANVSFYVFDPSGLGAGDTFGRTPNTRVAQMNSVATERAGQHGGESKFDRMKSLMTEGDNHEQLGQLASETGGIIVFNNNDLLPAFGRVLDETHNFYALVYHPENKNWDGSFRKLKVTLTAREGLVVRHRPGYWAIPRTEGFAMTPTQAHLFSSVRQGIITSTVKGILQSNIAMAADAHWYAPFSVAVPLSAAAPPKNAPKGKGELVVVAVAYDAKGKILSTYERHLDVTHPGGTSDDKGTITVHGQLALPGPSPVRVETILQLASGNFSISQQDAATSRSNAVAPLLSSLIVTDQVDQANCEDLSEALCVKNIRLRQRVPLYFAGSGSLLAYLGGAEFTIDPATKLPRVAAQFTIRSGDKVVVTVPQTSVQAVPGPTPESVIFIAGIPLNALPKGSYTMDATAFDLVHKSSSKQSREFQIQ